MKTFLTLVVTLVINLATFCQSAPELVFTNPVLVNGTANQQGAVYRFSNVKTGVDATIKLKRFSRNDIVMATVDNSVFGWDKAFQPEFGLAGLVASFQKWYIDFEITFYVSGTNTKQKIDTVDFTALDVDGDGVTINEFVTYDRPNSIAYSTLSALTNNPVGNIGQVAECGEDQISSSLLACQDCSGTGLIGSVIHEKCDGSGLLHSQCNHAYQGGTGSLINGPVTNFVAIDTSATQIMTVYRYLNTDRVRFRYGAKTGALPSNGSGIRLNAMWFRQFNLTPVVILPVTLTSFTAFLNNSKVDLKWKTALEVNVNYYTVERSLDGINYSDAGIVFAVGNAAASENLYSLTDNLVNVKSPVVYYRIRSVDIDGKSKVSEIRIVRLAKQDAPNSFTILTYPNPVSNELRITNPASWQNKKVTYEFFSLNGQLANKSTIAAASQTEATNISKLQPGIYMVKATCEGQIATQKIVKQ
jgi:hypothetical protein